MIKTIPVEPFEFSRLYGDEKYSLTEMTLREVNFPDEVEDGHVTSTWSDRVGSDAWYAAKEGIESRMSGDAWWNGVSSEDFLAFAAKIAVIVGFKHEVTGARMVRYTDGGGYPCLRLDITNGGKMVPKKRTGRFHPALGYGRSMEMEEMIWRRDEDE